MLPNAADEICAAIKIGFNETRCVLEPAGALAVAGMVKYIRENKVEGCTYVAISSGANMDFDRSVDTIICHQSCGCSSLL
jgi:threonine dehydratase